MAVAVAVVLDFNLLVIPNRPDMLGFALKLTRNKPDAEDLVQDTFCRAFMAWSEFRLPPNVDDPRKVVRGWLFCLVHNVFVDKWRSRRYREDRAEAHRDRILEETYGTTADGWDPREADPGMSDEVLEALKELYPLHRQCVEGHAAGKEYAEMAKELGVPIGTVMSGIHRGRRALKQKLVDYARKEYRLRDDVVGRGRGDAAVDDGRGESAKEKQADPSCVDGVMAGDDSESLVSGEPASDADPAS